MIIFLIILAIVTNYILAYGFLSKNEEFNLYQFCIIMFPFMSLLLFILCIGFIIFEDILDKILGE